MSRWPTRWFESHSDREQVEERLEEPRDEEDPSAPIGDDVALDETAGRDLL